jgi:L-fuconolactonase
MLQDIEDVNWILNDAFTSIFEFLIAHHLTFDALIKEQHLTVIERLARRYPKLKIVVNHCAKPSLYASTSQIWLRGISEVAKHKNVFIKFSGLLTEAPQGQVSIEKLLPYFNHILDNFGANRIMWGSDWPVLELNGHYFDWTALTHTLISPLSLQAQKSICATNAVKFYNLSEDSSL